MASQFKMTYKKMFMIDGMGALISAFLLGVVLPSFQQMLGIPLSAIYFLAVFPYIFLVYDFMVYQYIEYNQGYFLKGIAWANMAYCLISAGTLYFHFDKLTLLSGIYFVGEIAIVATLAVLELQFAKRNH